MTVVSTSATSPSISFAVSNHLYNHLWLYGKKVDEHPQISLKSEILKPYDGQLHVRGFQLNTTEYNRKSKTTLRKAYVPSIVHIYNRTEIVLPVQFFLQSHGAGSRYFSIFMPQTLHVILRTQFCPSIHQSIHQSIHPSIHPSIHLLICLSIHSFIILLFIHSHVQFLSVISLIFISTCAWTFIFSVLFLYLCLCPSISLTIDNIDIAIWVRIVPQYPCCKRPLKGAVLQMRSCLPRYSRSVMAGAIKIPLYSKDVSANLSLNFTSLHRQLKCFYINEIFLLQTKTIYSTRHTFWYSLMLIPSIHLLADPYACFAWLTLMLIPIENRSMLIVYWFGDRKWINAYLTKNSIHNINLPKEFLKI